MTDRPIIFSAPMVRALLEGRKTQTRRLLYTRTKRIKRATFLRDYEPGSRERSAQGFPVDIAPGEEWTLSGWERAKPGDRLWVRENWRGDVMAPDDPARTIYQADAPDEIVRALKGAIRWRPSIHLPRVRSRLTLYVTETKIERVQAISERDARAEGALYVPGHGEIAPADLAEGYSNYLNCRMGYEVLWRMINGDDAWNLNPWVVALTFNVHKANIDRMGEELAAAKA